ncbi:hypothetical protein SteCoe_3163 [Stentor coeruleus]|uniref:Uncharacterized protein n=1 Tax=Stentor coeruleus TaxID=5963 RepID=A0A1R2CXV1_9CILI|nr:hypothetical protein SteCoe_3163 [Stentor coeruleus]
MVKVAFVSCVCAFYVVYIYAVFCTKGNYNPGLSLNTKMTINIKPSYNYTDCSQNLCPWQNYSNSSSSPEIFQETSNLQILNEPIFCKPESFGYTDYEFNRVYKNLTFPTCAEFSGVPNEFMHINIDSRVLFMNCSGYYYLGGPSYEEAQGKYKYQSTAKKYTGPVLLNNYVEWAYGSCVDPKIIQGAAYSLKENQEARKRTRDKMQEMLEKNGTRMIVKPMTVINLFIDSVSRRTFYRKLPKTLELLQEINGGKFSVYDFKLSSTIDDNTLPNMFPFWAGEKLVNMTYEVKEENSKKYVDLIEDKSIWHFLKERGWMTMFSTEFCNDYLVYGLGKKPNVDHHMARFWCGAKTLLKFSDLQMTQRCFGRKSSQHYLFNTSLQYVNMYQGLNKWAYINCLTAHEDSGTHINTLDIELVDFLKQLINTKDDLVIFLAADHGMRYGEWFKLENGSQEHHLPSFFLIVSKSIASELPLSDDILIHNTKRLVSKFEFRKTVEHLSMLPYDKNYLQDSPKPIKANEPKSLLLHKISDEKHCEDDMINAEFCPCPSFIDFDYNHKIVKDVVAAGIYHINTAVFNEKQGWKVCKKITVKEVLKARLGIQDYKVLVKVDFSINEDKNITFEVVGLINGVYTRFRPPEQAYPLEVYYYGAKRIMQIRGITTSFTNDFCSNLAIYKGISPNICVCQDLDYIKDQDPDLDFSAIFDFAISESFESCEKICRDKGKICDDQAMEIANSCEKLKEIIGCNECVENLLGENDFGVYNNICYVDREKRKPRCESAGITWKVCACN